MGKSWNGDHGDIWHAALSPLRFLVRSADVWASRTAVVDGPRSWTYAEHLRRVEQAVGLLRDRYGVGPGDRVAILLPNSAAHLELHYAVPGVGGVLVPMNTRLAPDDYAYIIEHSGAAVLVADRAFEDRLSEVTASANAPKVVWSDPDDPAGYDALAEDSERIPLAIPDDEDTLLSINYTSGTTGRPKGVMTTHRGAYLHSLGVIAEARLGPSSVYLWSLPMFHCNGWAYTWAVTASGARHVCLRQVSGATMWTAIRHQRVTHMCGAPTVLVALLNDERAGTVPGRLEAFVGGAPPPPSLISRAEDLGIAITHLYGLTETYGPIGVCAWNPGWDDLDSKAKAALRARQGVATVVSEPLKVVDSQMVEVPRDGRTMGEIVMRGNNVMAGYYRDPEATREAFSGGWFHSGDLAVAHPDGYVEIRDRLKDVIISGGENISTIEVEKALLEFPGIDEAAVVAAPDERWGEVPVAYFTARSSESVQVEALRAFLRDRLAHFKVPRDFHLVPELPKTGTGKIQKFVLRAKAGHEGGRA